jgi:hypothetical protein
MTQPLGNCPGCGTDEPFAQVHPDRCPDVDGECPEWACVECGAGVIMGTTIPAPAQAGVPAGPSVRAA